MKLDKVTKRRLKRLLSPFVPRLARQERLRSVIGVAARSPTDWHTHFELAEHYFTIGRVIPAIAECRTSLAFGGQSPELYLLLARAYMVAGCAPLAKNMVNRGILSVDDVNSLQKAYGTDREGLLRLSPDRYQRLKALATRVEQAVSDPHMRILDIGSGDGALCLLMPDAQYVLAEPTANGPELSGLTWTGAQDLSKRRSCPSCQ